MDLTQVERLLCELGVDRRNPALWAAVIRFVQRAEGHVECFGRRGLCSQRGCAWRGRCQALNDYLEWGRCPWPRPRGEDLTAAAAPRRLQSPARLPKPMTTNTP